MKVKPKTLKAESYVIIIVQNFQMIKKIWNCKYIMDIVWYSIWEP